jgi:hypothetical protein
MPFVVDETVQRSPSSCHLYSHVEQSGTFEQLRCLWPALQRRLPGKRGRCLAHGCSSSAGSTHHIPNLNNVVAAVVKLRDLILPGEHAAQ